MLKYIALWGCCFLLITSATAQQGIYTFESDIVISGNDSVYVQGGYFNMDSNSTPTYSSKIINDGHLFLTGDFINHSNDVVAKGDTGYIHFIGLGNQHVSWSGDSTIHFNYLHINKPFGDLIVTNHIYVKRQLNFTKGNMILQQGNLTLSEYGRENIDGTFINEWDSSRVITTNGEEIYVYKSINPVGNVAGIGFHTKKPVFVASEIRRGNNRQESAGDGSIYRYFKFNPISAVQMDLRMDYFNPEVDTLIETFLDVWKSDNNGVWRNQFGLVDPVADTSFKSFDSTYANTTYTIAEKNCRITPIVEFGMDTIYLCMGDSVQLDLDNPNHEFQWSTGENTQTISVKTSGKYYGSALTIKGCTGSDTVEVIVSPIPTANFDFDDLVVCENDSMHVSDSSTISTGNIVDWQWDFGVTDSISDTSIVQNAAHLYPQEYGNYNVQLIVTSDFGCSDTILKPKIIFPLPTIGYSVSDSLCEGNSIVFNDTSSVSFGGILNQFWEFGDGNSMNGIATTNHLYAGNGSFATKLIVTTNAGCVDSLTKNITINQRPTSDFNFDRQCSNLPIAFTNNSNLGYYHQWSFGDGDSSQVADPTHLYAAHGNYTVSLNVTSANGCTHDTTQLILVDTIPNASFTAGNACQADNINFNNNSSLESGIMLYSWTFGDGNGINAFNANHSYINPGTYQVQLLASNSYGCFDSVSQAITVHPRPNAGFTISENCLGQNAPISNTSAITTGTLSYNWDMGDGNIYSNLITPTHNYAADGKYLVTLEVISDQGCKDTISDSARINAIPFINFGDTIRTCSAFFLLDAQNAGSTFAWSNNSFSQTLNVTSTGSYHVEIISPFGCSFRDTVYVLLNTLVEPDLGLDRTVCDGVTLDAFQPGSNYLWSTSANSASINATNSGLYWVRMTDQNGCIGTDTVSLVVNSSPVVNLGADTLICSTDSILLNASNPTASFLWSTGEISQSLYKKSTGSYWVRVTGTNNCVTKDTIHIIQELAPIMNLADSSTFCGSGILNPMSNAITHTWSSTSNTSTINVNSSGTYSVIGYSQNGCASHDTSYVSILSLPAFSLGNDTAICNQDSLVLSIPTGSILWSDGSSQSNYVVYSTGSYHAVVTGSNGCTSNDTINVLVYPGLEIELGGTIELCGNGVQTFEASYPGTPTWSWNGVFIGSDSIVSVDTSGTLSLSMDWNNCTFTDTVDVVAPLVPLTADFLIPSTVSIGDTVQIVQVSFPQPISTYSWTLGDGTSSNEKHPTNIYYLTGTYEIQLTVENGNCTDTLTKSIEVVNQQEEEVVFEDLPNGIRILSSKVYPNPTTGLLTLEALLNQSSEITLRLFDFNGKMIMMDEAQGQVLQKQINLESLPAGIYFLVLNTQDYQYTHKIILY